MYLDKSREIRTNLTAVCSAVLWVLAVALWAISWVVDQRYLSSLSLLVVTGAATLSIRSFMLHQAEEIRTALVVTGRDVVKPHVVP